MEKCWDSDPFKRPTIIDLENIISQWLRCVNEYYKLNNENDKDIIEVMNIDNQSRSDMHEFVKPNRSLTQEQINISTIKFHPQAYYTSRLLTKILDQNNSAECLDCIIEN
ncbi:hypothetical protein C1645_318731 [Glomus cerebriforme]|uniref:Serine-threonine/tyrosine-protein kinase catalytic domain-containing protein n=1 Tax=Glomus cerebriforme TaxID=658196 RepID=A0A397SRW1_9GLOM|nr:hypothetical protein C1645_318731 [Glomus cerebriforme]